jgi:hypothetical protein
LGGRAELSLTDAQNGLYYVENNNDDHGMVPAFPCMTSRFRFLALLTVIVLGARPVDAVSKPKEPDPLEILKATAAVYPDPGLWDAAVFLPVPAIRPFLASLKNTDVIRGKPVQLTVVDVDLGPDWGVAQAKVTLRLSGPAGIGPAEFVVNAQLKFDGFTAVDVGSGTARFHVAVDASAVAMAGVPGALLTQLTKANAFAALSKDLVFSIPVPLDFSQKIGFDEEFVVRAGTEGWVKVHAKVPDSEFRLKVDMLQPIFVPSGVWLCVRFVKSVKPAESSSSAANLAEALSAYEQQSSQSPKLLVNGGFLATFVNDLATLPDSRRSAKVTVTKADGRLFKSGGDTYVAVWLQNANKASAELTVKPQADWNGSGLQIACGYHAHANADFHIHADPGPSGGFGTNVGTIADSDGIVKAILMLDTAQSDGASVAFLRPTIDLKQDLTATLRTNGRAKINFAGGWFNCSIPSFGVQVSLPVPPDLIPPITLLTNNCIPLAAGTTPVPISAVITPRGAEATVNGYAITFDAAIVGYTAQECAAREQEIAAIMHSTNKPDLAVGKVDVLIGDWAFGKNNAFVKFVVETVKAAENIERAGEIALKDTGRELTVARKNVGRETTKTWHGVRREGGAFVRDVHGAVKATGNIIPHPPIPHPHIDTPIGKIKL